MVELFLFFSYMLFRIPEAFYNKHILLILGGKPISAINQFLLYLVFFLITSITYNALMEDRIKRLPSQGRALHNYLFMKMQLNLV